MEQFCLPLRLMGKYSNSSSLQLQEIPLNDLLKIFKAFGTYVCAQVCTRVHAQIPVKGLHIRYYLSTGL